MAYVKRPPAPLATSLGIGFGLVGGVGGFLGYIRSVASRAFPVAAPQVWNALPEDVTSASSFRVSQSRLKTFLFQRSFSV